MQIQVQEHSAHIVIVTIDHQPRRNAMTRQMMAELAAVWDRLEQSHVRCIILTGAGERAFCAGADMRGDLSAEPEMAQIVNHALLKHRPFSKPIIAAVNGLALGGGCELAMLCDIIVASETAQFGQPEINLGIMPGAGGTQRLTRAIGKYRAMEMVLTGRPIPARQAEAWGLVTKVVPPEVVLDEAKGMAREIAGKAPVAVRLAKESVLKAFDTHLEGGLDFERKCFYLLFATEDRAEGISAFLEKRKAIFKGR